jgi:RHS repeat-associated protein
MSQFPPAARLGDPIAHSNANARLFAKVVGIAAGAAALGALCAGTIAAGVAAGVAAVSTVATGGLAAPILAGAVVLTGALASAAVAYAGGSIGEEIADWLVPESWEVTGEITTGSADVFVNGIPAARATNAVPLDEVVCGKHTITPVNLIAQGAAVGPKQTVINAALAARKGDKVVCGATIHEGSPNVFIGGEPETVRDFDSEVNPFLRAALFVAEVRNLRQNVKCLWKLVKDPKALIKSAECLIKAGQAAGSAALSIPAILSNPVHIATGAKLLAGEADLDFVLPGVLPVVWQRVYNSLDLRSSGSLGKGWSTPYSMELHLRRGVREQEQLVLFDTDGRDITFDAPVPGGGVFSVAEGVGVQCSVGGEYVVVTAEGRYQWFGQVDPGRPHVLSLLRVEDRNGSYHALRYDEMGRFTHLADSAGRVIELQYAVGTPWLQQVVLRVGAEGEVPHVLVRYEHDSHGHLTGVQDRSGQVSRRFAYAGGRLVRHELPTGLNCYYEWTEFDHRLGDRSGPHARVARHWTDDGEQYVFTYQFHADGGGTTSVADGLSRNLQWEWNSDYEITRHMDALGSVTVQTWSETKHLLTHADPLGRTTSYSYDDAGNLVAETDPLGRTQRWRWSPAPASLLMSAADPAGAAWSYQYDDLGNLTAEVDPLGSVTRYANNPQGLPVVVTDAHGGRKQLRWDRRALLSEYTDCSGKTTRFFYDKHGYLQHEIDAMGNRTALEHDPQGRLLKLTLPDGAEHHYRYDNAGQCVLATDALGHSTSYSYNLRGQLTGRSKTIGALSSNIQLGYDAARRLAALINANRQAYQFTYDAADRLVSETRIDGTRQVLHHDAAGQVIGVTEHPMPMGQGDAVPGHADVQPIHTQLVRDAAGQLVQKNIYTPGAGTGTADAQPPVLQTRLEYRYTPAGDLQQAQQFSPQGEVQSRHTWQYDKLGQVLQESAEHAVQGQLHNSTLHYQYDALGNRIATQLPDGRTVNHLYYGSGHLHQINLGGAVLADIERDDLHREVLRTQGRLASRFAYDPVGRKAATWVRPAMLRVGHGIGNDQHASAGWSPQSADWTQRLQRRNPEDTLLKRYGYDKNGELTSTEHSQQGQTNHRYDQAGRITHTTQTGQVSQPGRTEQFHYDLAGNRISALEESNLSTQGRGWVQDNRVKVLEDKRYDYDGFGRLIRKRIGSHTEQHYRYDHQHRLTQVAVVRAGKDGQPQSQVFSYQYDALGRRIAKTDNFGTTLFTWEGMRLLQERRQQNTSTYIYEPESYVPLARIDGSGAVEPHPAAAHALGGDAEQGKLGSVPTTNPGWSDRFNIATAANDGPTHTPAKADATTAATGAPTAQVYYFHTQPNGLPEELSDSGGNLVWQAQYTTWGSTVREVWQSYDTAGRPQQQLASQTASLQQNLRMQGQYLDRETGLHYNTFRYYDADLGAFTTPDPIGLLGGLNLHQYAPNPILWIDPWGWACGPTWTKKGWKHVNERHVMTTKPRWSHKSKFELGKEGNVKKAIDKTVRHGNATPQRNGRTKYELDHKQKVGSKKDPQTGVSKDQTKITVVTDKHGNVVTSFPSD